MKIAILDDYLNKALTLADWRRLPADCELHVFNDTVKGLDAVAERLADFEVVCLMRERTPFPRALIERLPKLKLIITSGPRNLSIDLKAAAERGIPVSGTRSFGHSTVELTWGLILSVVRSIPQQVASMREGGWQTALGNDLRGKTLGVVGLGKLGSQVAAIGKAFGMEVVAWSQNLTDARVAEVGVRRVDKAALFATADVVTVHLILSDRSRGTVGKAEIEQMKPSAYLVNTSRGPIVDTAALLEALDRGRLAGAAVDVYDEEPTPPDHPIRRHPKVVPTPHLGYVSEETFRLFYAEMVEDLLAWLDGKPIRLIEPPKG